MRDKLLPIRVDEDFLSKLEYLQKINGFKTIAETVRKIVEKEWRKEQKNETLNKEKIREQLDVIEDIIENKVHPTVSPDRWGIYSALHDEIEQLEILLKQ